MDAPGVPKNLSTPLIGVWERINIGIFLLWVVVLAIVLLRAAKSELPATFNPAAKTNRHAVEL